MRPLKNFFLETWLWDSSRDEDWARASRGGGSAARGGEVPGTDPVPTGAGETAGGARGAKTAGLRGVPEGEADDRRDRPQDLRGGPEVRHRDRVDCFILYLCVKDIKSFVCSKLKSLYILFTLRR